MLKGKIIDVREDGTAVIEAPIDIGQFIHRKVKADFCDKYHLEGGVECDKTILKIYGLKR